MVQITGLTGPVSSSDGGTPVLRTDKTSSLVNTPGRAPLAEQVSRGLAFAAAIPPGTGQAPGTAIGTTGAFVLANGSSSTVNLVVYKIMASYISGTLGAGTLGLLAHASAGSSITAPSGGTAITPTNMRLGATATSAANCRFNATVPASGLLIRCLASLQASLASTAVGGWQVIDDVRGEVVIGPGQAVSVQGIAAAGSSPLIVVACVWAEEPIVSGY